MAIQTIYRELDRARTLIQKHAKRDDDSDEFEEDWTLIEDDAEADVPQPFEIQQPIAGMSASRMGGGSVVLGSMALKGASAAPKAKEFTHRDD